MSKSKPQKAWTADEVEVLYKGRDEGLTLSQVAERLGRPPRSVVYKVQKLGIRYPSKPTIYANGRIAIGARPLIAKSCAVCGRLLAAARFPRRATGKNRGFWNSECLSCGGARNAAHPRRPMWSTAGSKAWSDEIQKLTLGQAYNRGTPWSAEDLKVVADANRSLVAAALITHRTYQATSAAANRIGVRRIGNAELRKRWVITLRQESVERALEMEAQGLLDPTGIPLESEWDWAD